MNDNLKTPVVRIVMQGTDTGEKTAIGAPMLKYDFEVHGEDHAEIFSMLCEFFHVVPDQFFELFFLAVKYKLTHDAATCPYCNPEIKKDETPNDTNTDSK